MEQVRDAFEKVQTVALSKFGMQQVRRHGPRGALTKESLSLSTRKDSVRDLRGDGQRNWIVSMDEELVWEWYGLPWWWVCPQFIDWSIDNQIPSKNTTITFRCQYSNDGTEPNVIYIWIGPAYEGPNLRLPNTGQDVRKIGPFSEINSRF